MKTREGVAKAKQNLPMDSFRHQNVITRWGHESKRGLQHTTIEGYCTLEEIVV